MVSRANLPGLRPLASIEALAPLATGNDTRQAFAQLAKIAIGQQLQA